MLYTLTFTKRVDGRRELLMDETLGIAKTIQVEAESRSGAIYHDDTAKCCADNDCSVRRVLP